MLAIAKQRAQKLGSDADLRLGDAQALEFPNESFDTVAIKLGLCTIPDSKQAIREPTASCDRAVACSYSSTSVARVSRSAPSSASSIR
jgi:Methyltransferase domain